MRGEGGGKEGGEWQVPAGEKEEEKVGGEEGRPAGRPQAGAERLAAAVPPEGDGGSPTAPRVAAGRSAPPPSGSPAPQVPPGFPGAAAR